MATINSHRYEVDLVIRRLDDKSMEARIDPMSKTDGIERFEVTQEIKHLKLGWKEALKILFDKFI